MKQSPAPVVSTVSPACAARGGDGDSEGRLVFPDEEAALGAQRDDDGARSFAKGAEGVPCKYPARGGLRVLGGQHRHARDGLELALVGDKEVRALVELREGVEAVLRPVARCGCGVCDGVDPAGVRVLEGRHRCLERDLQLAHKKLAPSYRGVAEGSDVTRGQHVVRAGHDDDAVAPATLDHDLRHPCGRPGGPQHVRGVHPLRAVVLERVLPEQVFPHAGDHPRLHAAPCLAEPGARNALVRALPPKPELEVPPPRMVSPALGLLSVYVMRSMLLDPNTVTSAADSDASVVPFASSWLMPFFLSFFFFVVKKILAGF